MTYSQYLRRTYSLYADATARTSSFSTGTHEFPAELTSNHN